MTQNRTGRSNFRCTGSWHLSDFLFVFCCLGHGPSGRRTFSGRSGGAGPLRLHFNLNFHLQYDMAKKTKAHAKHTHTHKHATNSKEIGLKAREPKLWQKTVFVTKFPWKGSPRELLSSKCVCRCRPDFSRRSRFWRFLIASDAITYNFAVSTFIFYFRALGPV